VTDAVEGSIEPPPRTVDLAAPWATGRKLEGVDGIALDHSVLGVSDWEISNRFYRDVVGAEIIEVSEGRWAYRLDRTQLNVHGPGVDVSENVARIPVKPGNSDLCFVWPWSIEEAMAHLADHGVDVELGPIARFGARGRGTSVYFRDPDGNLLEFISYL
jgi:catechol 2,3-dioxygenase-like lactoylglutathione lyase family enzyme